MKSKPPITAYLLSLGVKLTPKIVEEAISSSESFRAAAWSRLMRYVKTSDDCWEWTARAVANHGYGKLNFAHVTIRAHRLSYIVHRGPIPDGLSICHSCDNTSCVNPGHLFAATHIENVRDAVRKGRNSRPPLFSRANHPRAKLTLEDVVEIRSSESSNVDLARTYGVCEMTIYRVRR